MNALEDSKGSNGSGMVSHVFTFSPDDSWPPEFSNTQMSDPCHKHVASVDMMDLDEYGLPAVMTYIMTTMQSV